MAKLVITGFIMAGLLVAGEVAAKVPPVEAARLGADLTPVGAERAGNDAGTIPPGREG